MNFVILDIQAVAMLSVVVVGRYLAVIMLFSNGLGCGKPDIRTEKYYADVFRGSIV